MGLAEAAILKKSRLKHLIMVLALVGQDLAVTEMTRLLQWPIIGLEKILFVDLK